MSVDLPSMNPCIAMQVLQVPWSLHWKFVRVFSQEGKAGMSI